MPSLWRRLRRVDLVATGLVWAWLPLVGCGASEASTSASVTDAGTPAPGSRAPWCPEMLPDAGVPCTSAPATPSSDQSPCEYGSDPHCTTIALCLSGTWTLQGPDPSCRGNSAACPASFDAGNTDVCTSPVACTYAAGRCSCISCEPFVCSTGCRDRDAGSEWHCASWQQPPGCPEPRPLLGTACSEDGQECGDVWGPPIECSSGYWRVPSGGC